MFHLGGLDLIYKHFCGTVQCGRPLCQCSVLLDAEELVSQMRRQHGLQVANSDQATGGRLDCIQVLVNLINHFSRFFGIGIPLPLQTHVVLLQMVNYFRVVFKVTDVALVHPTISLVEEACTRNLLRAGVLGCSKRSQLVRRIRTVVASTFGFSRARCKPSITVARAR